MYRVPTVRYASWMGKALVKEGLSERLYDLIEPAPDSRNILAKDGLAVGSLKGPRDGNEDRVCAVHIAYASRPSSDLLVGVVCDGMGGMRHGGVASTLAMSAFLAELISSRRLGGERLRDAITEANKAVYDRLQGRGGTTLTAIAISPPGDAWSVHAGDSRLYSYTSGDLSLLTQDDTISGIVNSGDPDHIEDSQDSRLIQFVGIGSDLQPHVSRVPSGGDKAWLLTSDGAHGLGRNMMRNIAANARSGVDLARKILFVVDAAPLGDNASVVALSPAHFEVPKRYRSGVNLTVWTPTERLELWLEDAQSHAQPPIAAPSVNASSDTHSTISDTARTTAPRANKTKGKPRSSKSGKKSEGIIKAGRPIDPAQDGENSSTTKEPLLNIVFGDEGKQ